MKNYLGLLGAVALTLAACGGYVGSDKHLVRVMQDKHIFDQCLSSGRISGRDYSDAAMRYELAVGPGWTKKSEGLKDQVNYGRPSDAACAQIRGVAQSYRADAPVRAAEAAQQSANIRARLNSGPTTCFQPMPGTTITCF